MLETVLNLKKLKDVSHLITEVGKQELQKVLEYCKKEKIRIHSITEHLKRFIEFDVPPDWVERIKKSKNVFKNDSASLECYINRYGPIIGPVKYSEKVKKSTLTKEKYLLTHTIEEWEALNKSKSSNNLENLIEKYGLEEAIKRKKQYLKKWKKSINKRKQQGWNNGLSLDKLIEKHGKEEAVRRWNEKKDKQRKRFSKEWYINKYGDILGEQKWQEYRVHMSKLSMKAIRNNGTTFSKISQKLFSEVVAELKIPLNEVNYHDCNGEKIIKKYVNNKYAGYYSIDFCYKNKVIEFDGLKWHQDKEKDITKDAFLSSKGYTVLRITDKEYELNPIATIEKCCKFLGE